MNTSDTPLISATNVSKIFRHRKARVLLRDGVRDLISQQKSDGFYAVRNVSFSVTAGESVAFIGANGAGKSTMLNLICGLTPADEGTITVNGHIAPLLDFGSGFHSDLTGRENLFLNAAFLGMTEKYARERYEAIVAFSELGEFINEPLRTYSRRHGAAPFVFRCYTLQSVDRDNRRGAGCRRRSFPTEMPRQNQGNARPRENTGLRLSCTWGYRRAL